MIEHFAQQIAENEQNNRVDSNGNMELFFIRESDSNIKNETIGIAIMRTTLFELDQFTDYTFVSGGKIPRFKI